MRYQGKIINWNDERGFGFVEPNGGGNRAFVHIKEFKRNTRRPVNGEIITYKLVRDSDHRMQAKSVKYAADSIKRKNSKKTNDQYSSILTIIFICLLLAVVISGRLEIFVGGIYLVMSIISYITYSIDKSAAQKGGWRIKESTLHLMDLVGGWPGGLLAQKTLRHKSSKQEFKFIFWVSVFVNIGLLIWLLTEDGAFFLKNLLN